MAERVDDPNPASHHVDVRLPEEVELFLEPFRVGKIIGIHPGDYRSTGLVGAPVGGGTDAAWFLLDQSESWIIDLPDDLGGVVGGTVVDDDQLQFTMGGAEDGAGGPLDGRGGITRGQHHGEGRWRHALGEAGNYLLGLGAGLACFSSAAGMKPIEAELTQYRTPVGLGPSSKTWPRWPSHFLQVISVRIIP